MCVSVRCFVWKEWSLVQVFTYMCKCVWVQRAKEGSVSFGFVRPPPSCFSVLLWAEGEACAWERQQLLQMSSGTQTLGG